jgi:prophage antirepressor-like protein
MGIELDVLLGHPEHELLFVATQVARYSGLKDPSNAVSVYRSKNPKVTGALQWRDALRVLDSVQDSSNTHNRVPGQPPSQVIQSNSWLASEGWVYRMLMRGDSKAAAEFRTWIADEVVPSIRKTGKYDAEQSTNPIALGLMDELSRSLPKEANGHSWGIARSVS